IEPIECGVLAVLSAESRGGELPALAASGNDTRPVLAVRAVLAREHTGARRDAGVAAEAVRRGRVAAAAPATAARDDRVDAINHERAAAASACAAMIGGCRSARTSAARAA